jgi:hypothetical protein
MQHSTTALVRPEHAVLASSERPLELQNVLLLLQLLAMRISSAHGPVPVAMLFCTARQLATSVWLRDGSLGQRWTQGSGAHATKSDEKSNATAIRFMIDRR